MRRLAINAFALVGESSWVVFSFFAVATLLFSYVFGVIPGVDALFNTTYGQLLAGGLVYAVVVGVVTLPILLRHDRAYVARILGVSARPTLVILWLPLVLWLAYMAITVMVNLGAQFVPWIDLDQEQQIGFDNLSQPFEYVIAFVALVILPPIAEELLFRGYLFGRLRKRLGFWLTTIAVSIMFGLVHLQWNVAIDVAILSVFLCYLRERTGTIWASMVLHAIKNSLAYFLLFIAPLLGWQLVQ